MPDIWTPAKRSEVMSRIRSRDTLPERAMRAALRRQHVKYRSYRKVRGITVDLLLPDLHTVVLVHGCFWHGCRWHYTPPSSNSSFWSQKHTRNLQRDARQSRRIRDSGWALVTVWEHSLETARDADRVVRRLTRRPIDQ
jgi:DNA mismatch endonuclease (patch repair protein)